MIAYFETLLRAERSRQLYTALAEGLHALLTALTGGIGQHLADQRESVSFDSQAAASPVIATLTV